MVLAMLLLSPIGNVDATSQDYENEDLDIDERFILQSYSRAVQLAFERVSEIDAYSEDILAITKKWLVVTGIPPEDHFGTFAAPDEVEEVEFLRGSFIWTFDESQDVHSRLAQSLENNEIETFSPMIDRVFSTRLAPNDALFDEQWHLDNDGRTNGTVGEDANVTGVWDSYNGSGVIISVIDDGVDHSHIDLSANYISQNSYDWCDDDTDPSPSSSDPHGTAVAGVAAGVANNLVGIAGAAFGAGIAGHRLIACGFSGSTEADALSFDNNEIDIYSNSWGPSDTGDVLEAPGPITIAAIESSSYNGRSGLGNIYTWAAGNGLEFDDNSNYDGWANNRHTIAVSAINHYGEQSYYSEPGANILVTAHSNGGFPVYQGISTTDITGSPGYSNGDYTSNFGGTSSATPLVSGVIALIMESNPNLNWRDIQNILVHSSRRNDANDTSWNMNGAGHYVSHKYGFGAIDAGQAVSLAENWTSSGTETNASFGPFNPGTELDNGVSTWTEFPVTVPIDIRLESVEVMVDISHTSRGNLDIVLESPSGHESWLSEEHDDSGNDYSNWMFGTVQHWDESTTGNWILKVRDSVSDSNSGTVNSWELIFHGVGNVSDTDNDGWPDYNDPDDDDDGWNDTIEISCDTDPLDDNSTPADTDSDGVCDFLDEDDDGDGFVDSEEGSCASDPLDDNSTPADTDSDGVCDFLDEDDDGDGLNDTNETDLYKTDPLDFDSDDDVLNDFDEIFIHFTSPTDSDTDDDGLDDYEEAIIFGTNPNSFDSDSDGISDFDEIQIWSSDPLSFDADEDSDSFYHFQDCDDGDPQANPDMEELLNNKDDNCDGFVDEGFNESDLDEDGLSDWSEYHSHGTEINNSDTDQDGLSDFREVEEIGSDPLSYDVDFDQDGSYWFDDCDDNDSSFAPGLPELLDGVDNDCDLDFDEDFLSIDSDSDGINDFEEYHNYSTDPYDGDSDGDGLPDGTEINWFMSDPLFFDPDSDQDGWYHFQDCDDGDFEKSPGRPEDLDGKDNDCDEEIDEDYIDLDSDGDGLSDFSEFHNYSTNPDLADSDFDGINDTVEIESGLSSPTYKDLDRDNDGFYEFVDCNDYVGSIFPGAFELWNGIDEDCDGEIDENVNRLVLVKTSQEISRGTVFREDGSVFDGPNDYQTLTINWDSKNESITLEISGIEETVGASISWQMSGYSLENNTSLDGKVVSILPIDCRNQFNNLQTQLCDEGVSIQKVKAVILEDGYRTEIEWKIYVSTWVEPRADGGLLGSITSPSGILFSLVFLVGISGGGLFVGSRLGHRRDLQDALEAYGVTPERLAISPENRGIDLPSAPELSWISEEREK